MGVMGVTTTCILFSGLCLALAMAECGDECKAKGGQCFLNSQNTGLEYLGVCREGSWPKVCYCGYCYGKPCSQQPHCKGKCSGKCQRESPGKEWAITGDCDRNSGCKCWERKSCPQTPNCATTDGPGWCGPDHPSSNIPDDEKIGPCDPFSKECICWKCPQDTQCTSVGGYCSRKRPTSSQGIQGEKRCSLGCFCHKIKEK